MEEKEFREQLLKKLNMIIALLIDLREGYTEKEITLREKIATLYNAGLNYKEIAQLLNKKPSYIAVEISTIKKRREKLKKALNGE